MTQGLKWLQGWELHTTTLRLWASRAGFCSTLLLLKVEPRLILAISIPVYKTGAGAYARHLEVAHKTGASPALFPS